MEVSFLKLVFEMTNNSLAAFVYIDEAQALLTDSSFRHSILSIKNTLAAASRCRVLLASGSLPGP